MILVYLGGRFSLVISKLFPICMFARQNSETFWPIVTKPLHERGQRSRCCGCCCWWWKAREKGSETVTKEVGVAVGHQYDSSQYGGGEDGGVCCNDRVQEDRRLGIESLRGASGSIGVDVRISGA